MTSTEVIRVMEITGDMEVTPNTDPTNMGGQKSTGLMDLVAIRIMGNPKMKGMVIMGQEATHMVTEAAEMVTREVEIMEIF